MTVPRDRTSWHEPTLDVLTCNHHPAGGAQKKKKFRWLSWRCLLSCAEQREQGSGRRRRRRRTRQRRATRQRKKRQGRPRRDREGGDREVARRLKRESERDRKRRTPKGGRRLAHHTPLLKIPVWWRRAVLPSTPLGCPFSFFLSCSAIGRVGGIESATQVTSLCRTQMAHGTGSAARSECAGSCPPPPASGLTPGDDSF